MPPTTHNAARAVMAHTQIGLSLDGVAKTSGVCANVYGPGPSLTSAPFDPSVLSVGWNRVICRIPVTYLVLHDSGLVWHASGGSLAVLRQAILDKSPIVVSHQLHSWDHLVQVVELTTFQQIEDRAHLQPNVAALLGSCSMALNWAYHLADTLNLYGIDMFGEQYFDGDLAHIGDWEYARDVVAWLMSRFIRQRPNFQVYSHSPFFGNDELQQRIMAWLHTDGRPSR